MEVKIEVVVGAWPESRLFFKSSGSLLRGALLSAGCRCSSVPVPGSRGKGPDGGGCGGATMTGKGVITVNVVGVAAVVGPETETTGAED